MLKIEKGIKIPEADNSGRICNVLREMKIGDSVFMDKLDSNAIYARCNYVKKTDGFKFSARKENDGYRVWRIK